MTNPKFCCSPLWIDDLCLENILDILEGKKHVEPDVLANIIEAARSKIDYTRRRHKSNITRELNKHNH